MSGELKYIQSGMDDLKESMLAGFAKVDAKLDIITTAQSIQSTKTAVLENELSNTNVRTTEQDQELSDLRKETDQLRTQMTSMATMIKIFGPIGTIMASTGIHYIFKILLSR